MSSRLQDHFVVLCQQLNVDRVLPILRQEKMVTMDEYETLTNPMLSTRQKREKLLIILPRKGKHHFEKFGECLVWSGQEQLAQTIGINVSGVNPRPANVPPPSTQPEFQANQQAMLEMLRAITQGTTISDGQSGPASLPVGQIGHSMSSQPISLPPGVYGGYSTQAPPNPYHTAAHTVAPQNTYPTHTAVHSAPTMQQNPFYPAQPHSFPTSAVQPQPAIPRARPPKPDHPPKVFILYCKDENSDICDDVLDLADLLNRSGGITCDFDGYDTHVHESNWSLWTEGMINNNDYVLLVCTPTLSAHLTTPSHTLVEMTKGKFYVDSIVNHISPDTFIPVFLNTRFHRGLIPTNLHATTHYIVNMSELSANIGNVEGMTEEKFGEKLVELLQEKRFEGIRSLLQRLRGDEVNPRPAPPLEPVTISEPTPHHPYISNPPPHHQYISNPPPPSTKAEFIAEGDLLRIAERLPRDWQHLGIKLGVEYSTLETFRTKYPYDTRAATMAMFGVWQQVKGRAATRKSLKQALMDLGYGRVAIEVFGRE